MFKFIEFLKKRPSDVTIRIIRFLLALTVSLLLVVFRNDYILPFERYFIQYRDWAIYWFVTIVMFRAIMMDILGKCCLKRGTVKKVQMILGVVCIIFASSLTVVTSETLNPATNCPSGTNCTISLESLEQKPVRTPVHVGFYLILIGIFLFLAGATGKLITEKCLKYKEVIKKIRV